MAREHGEDANGRERDRKNGVPRKDAGFFSGLFRTLRKHRVTLTRAGKSLAPMRKGGPAPKKKAGPARKAKREAGRAPATGRERQVNELKTLARIGKRSPERLASIISKMLHEAQEQEHEAKLRFERMVWEKAERRGPKREREREEGQDEGA